MYKHIKALLLSVYAVGCYLLCVLIPTYLDPIIASYWTDDFRSSVFQHETIFMSHGYTYGYELGYNISLFSILLFFLIFFIYLSKIKTYWKMIGIFTSFSGLNLLAMLLHFKCMHSWALISMVFLGGLLIVITAIDEIELNLTDKPKMIEVSVTVIIAIGIFFAMQLAFMSYKIFEGQIEPHMLSHLATILNVCYSLVLIYGLIGLAIGVIYPIFKKGM